MRVFAVGALVLVGCAQGKPVQPAPYGYPPYYPAPYTPPLPASPPPLSVPATSPPRQVEVPRPSDGGIVHLALALPAPYTAAGETLELELSGPAGGVWRCERRAPLDQGSLEAWCPPPASLPPGAYELRAKLAADALAQRFPVRGDERSLDIALSVTAGQKLARLEVRRVQDAPPEIALERQRASAWSGAPVRYRLVNGSRGLDVVGRGGHGIFIGTLEKREGDAWIAHTRGQLCDAAHDPVHLAPGASALVEEGHYIGELREMAAGRYRFRLRYRTASSSDSARTALIDEYELSDDFAVGADSALKRPKWGLECDPPYVIDAEGLRRVKRECIGY